MSDDDLDHTIPLGPIMEARAFTITRHLIRPDITGTSKVQVLKRTDDQIFFWYNNRKTVGTYVGNDKYLVAYDLNPEKAYSWHSEEMNFYPNEEGDFHIEKVGLDYFVRETGERVWLGPWYHFHLDYQLDPSIHANRGQLLRTNHEIYRCRNCEGRLMPHEGRRARFCSKECGLRSRGDVAAERAEKKRLKELNRKEPVVRNAPRELVCRCCDAVFVAQGPGNHHYCSSDCADRIKASRKEPIMKKCHHCTVMFEGVKNQLYCSRRCKLKIGPTFPMPGYVL